MNSRHIGRTAEAIAVSYLINNGYKIIDKNIYTPYGEVDIIAKENSGRRIHLFEVKYRRNLKFGTPREAITKQKLIKMKKNLLYLAKQKKYKIPMVISFIGILDLSGKDIEFDVLLNI